MILTSIINVIKDLGTGMLKNSDMNKVGAISHFGSDDYKKIDHKRFLNKDSSHGNIMKRAGDSVCYYPVIASNTVSGDNIRIFSKHLERNVAEMIKIIISQQDVVAVGDKDAAVSAFRGTVLNNDKSRERAESKQKHKDAMDHGISRANTYNTAKAASAAKNKAKFPDVWKESAHLVLTIMEESTGYMQDVLVPMDSGLNESMLSDYMTSGINTLLEIKGNKPAEGDEEKAKKGKKAIDKYAAKMRKGGDLSDKGEKFQYKANEMAPTVIESEIFYQTPGGQLQSTKLVFAVKSIFHPLPSTDLVSEIGQIISTNRTGFDLIKLYTGEISFWRDFVLNANEYKRQLADKASPATSMFSALQKHARDNDMAQILDGEKVVPTTTLVLTTDEVEAIKAEFAEDLRSTKTAKRLIEKANLMGLYIMDEAVDSMMMFNVAHGKYDKLSLPKEESKNKQDGQVFKALAAALKN